MGVFVEHTEDQFVETWIARKHKRWEYEWCFSGVAPAQQVMQGRAQTIDVATGRRLHLSVLFGRGIARRPEGHCVTCLPLFEDARDAKVDQVQLAFGRVHDIRWLEVAEDDWRLTIM